MARNDPGLGRDGYNWADELADAGLRIATGAGPAPDPVVSRGYNPNIAPPASGPQEAATPVEALAAEMEAQRDRWRAAAADTPDHDLARGRTAIGSAWNRAAKRVRELAPAWDALASRLAVQHEAMTQLRAGHAEALASLTAERDRAKNGARTLGTVVSYMAETIMAAWIDAKRGDHGASMEWLLQHIENVPEYEPWNGTETGGEWLERTGAKDAGRPRTYRDALAALAAGNERLREQLEALAVSWAEDADLPSDMTHDEIVEQQQRRECANELAQLLELEADDGA